MYIITTSNNAGGWELADNNISIDRDLKQRQEQHLKEVLGEEGAQLSYCAHDNCTACLGTGITKQRTICVHAIACSCPKCSPWS